MRLPSRGYIPLCGSGDPTNTAEGVPGAVVFRWRAPQGVCRILGPTPDRCPGAPGRQPGAGGQGRCAAAAVTASWRAPQLPTRALPPPAEAFNEATCETIFPVSDSNTAGSLWPAPDAYPPPGSYWLTSPVPGACEAGVIVRVDIVPPSSGSSSGGSSSGGGAAALRRAAVAAAVAAAAALLLS